MLRQTLRKEIDRVIANPLDINRVINVRVLWCFALGARRAEGERRSRFPASSISNNCWELGRRGELSADERPIVIVGLAAAIRLCPARQRHSRNHAANGGTSGFALMYPAPDLPLPAVVMSAVTSRIK